MPGPAVVAVPCTLWGCLVPYADEVEPFLLTSLIIAPNHLTETNAIAVAVPFLVRISNNIAWVLQIRIYIRIPHRATIVVLAIDIVEFIVLVVPPSAIPAPASMVIIVLREIGIVLVVVGGSSCDGGSATVRRCAPTAVPVSIPMMCVLVSIVQGTRRTSRRRIIVFIECATAT